jgi:hypothetical protein
MQLSNRIHRQLRRRRVLAVALTGALSVVAATGPTAASAKDIGTSILATTASGTSILETPDTRQTCTAPQLLPAFSSLGDMRDYVLAPGGSFEGKDLDGWQVLKAQTGGGGSPLEVQEVDENKRSLRIPAGGSATSPAMCVDLHYPTFRLMTKGQQFKGRLRVEVVYPDSENPVFHPVGSLTADSRAWHASADMPVFPERGGAAAGMRRVALRFTSVEVDNDGGAWRLDDLYVDPTRRN